MMRPPHWLDRHGHGEQAWPAGWVVDRYTVQLPVVGPNADASSPACEAQSTVVPNNARPEHDSAGFAR